ncbi:uncharacterized protein LOC135395657 [Ornithodoros turicata]|uniref:uncharacterized protein LOC135395657 n=1 Tax=Ornithodoros turicata TaxID=34597 RepID=UPI00313A450A
MNKKGNTPDIVARKLTEDYIQEHHYASLQIFTDASIDRNAGTSAAAFCIPALNVDWTEAIHGTTSTRDAEMTAILAPLMKTKEMNRQHDPVVILSDSKAALETISNNYEDHPVAMQILETIKELEIRGNIIALQWVPSHKGLPGNERADTLAKEAARLPSTLPAIPSNAQAQTAINEHVWCFHPDARTAMQTAPPLYVTGGFTREETSLLMRLRTRSAKTKDVLCITRRSKDPLCNTCDVEENIEHILLHCRTYEQQRERLMERMRNLGHPDPFLESLIYPTGPMSTRRATEIIVLDFMKESNLLGIL